MSYIHTPDVCHQLPFFSFQRFSSYPSACLCLCFLSVLGRRENHPVVSSQTGWSPGMLAVVWLLLMSLYAQGGAGTIACSHNLNLFCRRSQNTVPTIGFNVETVEYNNISFTVWDVGGQEKVSRLVGFDFYLRRCWYRTIPQIIACSHDWFCRRSRGLAFDDSINSWELYGVIIWMELMHSSL